MYYTVYDTDLLGPLTLVSDGRMLAQCTFGAHNTGERRDDLPIFDAARTWLDAYFAGERPDPRELAFAPAATAFQVRVREAMCDVPYGETTTYGAIARRIEAETGRLCAAQAVGGAVGRNPLPIIVPCHRVLGAGGALVGYSGGEGIATKVKLLRHEGAISPETAGFVHACTR